jgi:hypothetical protein
MKMKIEDLKAALGLEKLESWQTAGRGLGERLQETGRLD